MYEVGFRGVNHLDSHGFTPLMRGGDFLSFRTCDLINLSKIRMEKVVWLISKGADPYQRVPGSNNATVAHIVGLNVIRTVSFAFCRLEQAVPDFQEIYQSWEKTTSQLGRDVFLPGSVEDGCACACSPNGCTTLSVALREIVRFFSRFSIENALCFRQLFQFLVGWTKGNVGIDQAFIRFLTFHALDLKHTCCINHQNDSYPCGDFKLKSRDEDEIEEILDEERLRLKDLEQLMNEFEAKFDELGLPIMDFLDGYWHTRMMSFLSERDPYDEEHVMGARRIGVKLEVEEEPFFLDNVCLRLFGSKVKDVSDGSSEG